MSMLTYSFPKSVRQTVMSYTCTDPKTPVNSGHYYLMCNGPSLSLYLLMSLFTFGHIEMQNEKECETERKIKTNNIHHED